MAAQINFFYQQYVTTMMTIDEDDNGLFVSIPSESNGESYEVRCTEHADHVEVESCRCQSFRYRKSCKHVVIVQNWYNKIYASSIVKANEKALEQAMNASDLQEAACEEVALVEQIAATEGLENFSTVKIAQPVATPSPKLVPKVIKQGNKLVPTLNGQAQSNQIPAWLSILPSRQKTEAA